jgi:hypothetical protein
MAAVVAWVEVAVPTAPLLAQDHFPAVAAPEQQMTPTAALVLLAW